MRLWLRILVVAGALFLSSCSDEPKGEREWQSTLRERIESQDAQFSLLVPNHFQDQMPRRQRLVNIRMPGVDPNQLTLLQSAGDHYSSDLIYAISLPVAKRLQIDFERLMSAEAEGLQSHPQIFNYTREVWPESGNQAFYSAENRLGSVVMSEYCYYGLLTAQSDGREAPSRTLLLVCSASADGLAKPKAVIQSITLGEDVDPAMNEALTQFRAIAQSAADPSSAKEEMAEDMAKEETDK